MKTAICPGSFDPVTLGHMDIIRRASKIFDKVIVFDGFLADLARKRGACAIVKGLRAVSDFEYEFQMALINQKLNSELETMFLTTQAQNMYLSSSMIKDIASFGGDISSFVPACILGDIQQRLCKGGN